jgi:hypothetical protein
MNPERHQKDDAASEKLIFTSGQHRRRALRAYERMDRKRTARAEAARVQIGRGLRLSARQQAALAAAWMQTDEGRQAASKAG